jgi:major membrane immunogen (membrane-anchored lipoprotein)
MKKILAVLVLVVLMVALTGCGNRDMFDTVYTYNEAVLSMADGTIVRGKVENWRDYEDGEQIQVKIDGVIYLVNSVNITLMNK